MVRGPAHLAAGPKDPFLSENKKDPTAITSPCDALAFLVAVAPRPPPRARTPCLRPSLPRLHCSAISLSKRPSTFQRRLGELSKPRTSNTRLRNIALLMVTQTGLLLELTQGGCTITTTTTMLLLLLSSPLLSSTMCFSKFRMCRLSSANNGNRAGLYTSWVHGPAHVCVALFSPCVSCAHSFALDSCDSLGSSSSSSDRGSSRPRRNRSN